jgi:His/Glu/Gln/Arg/opine family amino acid ABC transporter permease subunit
MGKAFDAGFFIDCIGDIFKALPITVLIAVVGFFAGLIIGFFAALARKYKVPVLKHVVTFYTSFIRGTPLLVQIYLAYYGLPMFLAFLNERNGWNISVSDIPALYFVFVAYSLNTGAYLTETVRASIETVDRGQYEAAQSIGMTGRQTFTRIVLPQAFIHVLPNLCNSFISLLKDTSLAFSVTILELIGTAKVISARSLRFFEAFLAAALIYWITCIVCEIIVNRLEKMMRRKRGMA